MRAGYLPSPFKISGRNYWRKKDIDKFLDEIGPDSKRVRMSEGSMIGVKSTADISSTLNPELKDCLEKYVKRRKMSFSRVINMALTEFAVKNAGYKPDAGKKR